MARCYKGRLTADGDRSVGTALVTGAAGFIGVHLIERLLGAGARVRGLDDERSGDWSRVDPGVERVVAPLESLDDGSLDRLVDGVDVVFHLAAEKYNSPRATPETILRVNVDATRRLFSAAARAGARKVVFTSSLYAYGSLGPESMRETDVPAPTTMYGVSKLAGEHLLRVVGREHGLRWTVARLFFVYGPRQFAEGGYKSVIVVNYERLRRGERPLIHGDGAQTLDYVYVDDAFDALIETAADAHHGRVYNVSSGRGVSIAELTRLMQRAAGTDLEPVHDEADWTAGTHRVGNPSLASTELGWRAATPIEDGVRRVWDWLQAEA
jgi:UDP-glucose 4-epimerase